MAVDTAQKRYSMLSFGDDAQADREPEVTALDTAEERIAFMSLYLMIPTATPPGTLGALRGGRRRRYLGGGER